VYGTAAIGGVIARSCDLAQKLELLIRSNSKLEMAAPVALNVVCFRYLCVNRESDYVNRNIVLSIQEGGAVAPSYTTIDGKCTIRAALINHRTCEEDIVKLIEQVDYFGPLIDLC
jgi:aromatic-L-amino-acid decarboxylase